MKEACENEERMRKIIRILNGKQMLERSQKRESSMYNISSNEEMVQQIKWILKKNTYVDKNWMLEEWGNSNALSERKVTFAAINQSNQYQKNATLYSHWGGSRSTAKILRT